MLQHASRVGSWRVVPYSHRAEPHPGRFRDSDLPGWGGLVIASLHRVAHEHEHRAFDGAAARLAGKRRGRAALDLLVGAGCVEERQVNCLRQRGD